MGIMDVGNRPFHVLKQRFFLVILEIKRKLKNEEKDHDPGNQGNSDLSFIRFDQVVQAKHRYRREVKNHKYIYIY